VNYCPLAFLEASGRNQTPNKLLGAERERLFKICDEHLRRVLEILQPEWLIGIGDFANKKGALVVGTLKIRVGKITHPSPASPKANRRDWTKTATEELVELGVWK
jgi:single-strand selective monofunctional uracil DNA glycosylase